MPSTHFFINLQPSFKIKCFLLVFGAILGVGTALDELDVLDLGIADVGSDDDVGAGKDRGVIDLVGFNARRDQ
ncbi:hypothetical protein GYH30_024620 [Glycine max]|nr:hypothetical protein GYH30_024620 [Glycine max]